MLMLDGKIAQKVYSTEDGPPIVGASLSDPYIAIKRADGTCAFFVGDSVARQISETEIPDLVSLPVLARASALTDRVERIRRPNNRSLYR